MENTHISELLAAYAEGELAAPEHALADAHLAVCAECRAGLEDVSIGLRAVAELPLTTAPDAVWNAIGRELDRRADRRRAARWLAAAAALLIVATAVWYVRRTPGERWEVEGIASLHSVGVGDWIETGPMAEAKIKVGSIGTVDMTPHTRLRVITAKPLEHRLSLVSGRIHARITAPPRLFFVDTAAGAAVDLGCEYDLVCDREGNGYLRVMQGWVSYEWQGKESLVPAGASCRTRAGHAPGTPFFDDAPAGFSEALARFDGDGSALPALLATARQRDTLTLWHLLTRVTTEADRLRVFERMVSFAPLPPGVSRDHVLSLDRAALRQWREELAWTW
ncbi:MAG: zf-HC2 domain-containing protein [Acidobacteria bacterium]|nr:zf-HC2 domain-containing protein [Acidobacteriota bacterium]